MAAARVTGQGPILQQFQLAVEYGDIEKAKQIASQLAQQKACLKIAPRPTDRSGLANGDISVKVYLEDKDTSGPPLTWTLNPSMTIKELKEKLEEEQDLPQQVQKWIIGKRIRRDEETLSSCNVKISGTAIYVYLLSASKVGLTRQQFENRRAESPAYDVPVSRTVTEPVAELRLGDEYDVPARHHVAPPVPDEPAFPSISQVGWRCEQCTYFNEPTRPGCEMCAADRPAEYVVRRDLKYVMSEKEKRRLEREEESERLAREINDGNVTAAGAARECDIEINVDRGTRGIEERLHLLDGLDSITRQELIKDAQKVTERMRPPENIMGSRILEEDQMDRYYQSIQPPESHGNDRDDLKN